MAHFSKGHYRSGSISSNRKLSDNTELPKNYPNLTPNGTLVQKTDLLASVQNLPAVLTDPRKGKLLIIFNIFYISHMHIESFRYLRLFHGNHVICQTCSGTVIVSV